ncbi:FAD-dependent oxidoreductase [Paenibacillus chungangensis]|uniref:FAD-dependent oxidoreductase n=1 Tax=Paenibacillus chungangensis TaxID=696535 RepID=A0ABW3HSU2_9BACL
MMMTERTAAQELNYDVVVVGGGSAGIAAAAAAARNGARTLIVDAGPTLGGELLSGMTIDGAINARGEWIVGGVLDELIEELKQLDGYVGAFNDWRLIRYVCIDPVMMQMAVMNVMRKYGVDILLHTIVEDVVMENGHAIGLVIRNKGGRRIINVKAVADCSGDGDVSAMAGAPFEIGSPEGELQPVSMIFRMSGVETEPLLEFVRDHPEFVAVGESEEIRGGRTDKEIVEELYKQGQPTVFFKGNGPLLANAIQSGEMFPTALIMIQPTSSARQEVCINCTRVAHINALNTEALSGTMGELFDQINLCIRFLRSRVPGFKNAHLSAIAPRIGIRETRRIRGEYMLTGEDAQSGIKFEDGVAKGCHHIDIHQDGTKQVRIPIAGGGSYDIPFRSLVPLRLRNVLVAGRCLSADRAAQGTARVMGGCLAMGQAAGTASAMYISSALEDMRSIEVGQLRTRLKEQGAIIDGTH